MSIPRHTAVAGVNARLNTAASVFPSSRIAGTFLRTRNEKRSCARLGDSSSTICSGMVSVSLGRLGPLVTYPRDPSGVMAIRDLGNAGISRIYVNSYAGSSLLSVLGITTLLGNGAVSPSIDLSVSPNSGRILAVLTSYNTLDSVLTDNTEILRYTYNPYVNVNFSPGDTNISLHAFGHGFVNEDNATSTNMCLMSPRATMTTTVANCVASPELLNSVPGIAVPRDFGVSSDTIVTPTDRTRTRDLRVLHNPGVGPFPRTVPRRSALATRLILGMKSGVAASRVVPTNTGVLPCHSGVPRLSRFYFNIYSAAFPTHTGRTNRDVIMNNDGCNRNSSHRRTTLIPLCLNIHTIVTGDFTHVRTTGLVGTNVVPLAFTSPASCSGLHRSSTLRLASICTNVSDNRVALAGGAANSAITLYTSFASQRGTVLGTNNLLTCAGRGKRG